MSRSNNQAKALVDAWFILLRYKWRFIFPLFIVSAAVLALSLLLPRKYQAEAVFDRRTDQVLASIMVGSGQKTYDQHTTSIKQELTNGLSLDKAIDDVKPFVAMMVEKGGQDVNLAELRRDMARKLQVQFEIATQEHERISVKYIGTDPVLSRLVINRLVHNYIDQAREQIAKGLEDTQNFFYDEVDRTRVKIENLENQKLTYEIKYAELLPDSPNSISMIQTQLDERVADLTRQLNIAKNQKDACEQALASTSQTINSLVKERNPELIRLETKLRDLQNEYRTAVVVNKMTDRHPQVQDLQVQIAQVKQVISNTETEVVTRKTIASNNRFDDLKLALTQAQTHYDAIEAELNQVAERRQQLDMKASELFPIRSQYRKITRQMDQLQRELQFWEENLRRVQMARSAEDGNRGVQLAFIRPCTELTRPVAPNMFQILISAMGLGLISGAISLLFAHRTDETFHDGEQLSNSLHLPLLGEVSEIVSVQHRRMRKVRNMVLYPLNAVAMTTVLVTLVSVLYMNLQNSPSNDAVQNDPMQMLQQQLNTSTKDVNASVDARQAD
ncbi:MAG: GumC family protein [Phycisphaeraceae bacterium JB051]